MLISDPKDYLPIKPHQPCPEWWTQAQRELHDLLSKCAEVFVGKCGTKPCHALDTRRQPHLLYQRGLGQDEATAFLRAIQHGIVQVKPDSNFQVPHARECSNNLHLLSRNADHFRVNTEALIHVGAFAGLILDRGWDPSLLVFDPFFSDAALDLWGYAEAPQPNAGRWEGRIIFVAEAKARVRGPDSLSELVGTFENLQKGSDASGSNNHRRKWKELVRIVQKHGPVEMLLMADGARWWYEARPNETSAILRRLF